MKKVYNQILTMALLVILSVSVGHAQVTVTVTNPSNTTPNLAASYPSLATAITALNGISAISGPVILTAAAGTETAPAGGFVINYTAATTASNYVVISGTATTTITASGTLTSGALNDALFKIIGSDYVTIQNFTLQENPANTTTAAGTNNMTEWGVALLYASTTNGAQYNAILNCNITLNRTYQNTFGIYSNSTHSATAPTTSATATTTAGGNRGLSILGNAISNVNNGIIVVGPTAAADQNEGLNIGASGNANVITNFGTTGTFSSYANVSGTINGILVRNTRNFNVSYNTVTSSVGGTTVGTLNGIQVPAYSNAPTGTFTNTVTYNIISLQSANATGAINGINYLGTSASATSVANISNNNFTTFGHTVAASGTIIFINAVGTHLSQTISNNTFTNISVNTTGSVTFISHNYSIPATGSLVINNNSIVTGFIKTGAGGTVMITATNATTGTGAVNNYTNNNFSNISVTGATGITGFNNTDGGTGSTKTITGNTFNNWTGGTSSINAMNFTYWNGVSSLSNNTISNITGQSSVTGITLGSASNAATSVSVSSNTINNLTSTGTGGAVTGITCINTSPLINISNNAIGTLASTGASAVSGISIGGATSTSVYKNTVCNLSGSNASSTVNGILVSAGTLINLSNNRIGDLRAPAANASNPVNGISINGGTTVNAYYNTVNLAASSTGALFGSSAINASTSTTLTLANNNFVNNSTPSGAGLAVAYRRSTSTLTSYTAASDRNNFYAPVLFSDGTTTQTAIGAYKIFMATRDANSISQNPPFLSTACGNANFLKVDLLTATGLESGGANISGITDDFENDIRFGNPGYPTQINGGGTGTDIGADEFDGTPLQLCAGIPAASTILGAPSVCSGTGTTLTLSTVYNDLGISYQWKSSLESGGTYTDAGTGTSLLTGALSATTYYICVITCSYSGQSFTTEVKSVIVKPIPTAVAASNSPVCAGLTLNLTGTSDIGTSFSWAGVNGFTSTSQNPDIVNVTTASSGAYSFTATADGCSSVPGFTNVTINPAPTAVTASASSTAVCAGIPFDLFSSAISNSPSSSYTTSTILSPTADGGFETGGTFPLNNWTVLNGTYNNWFVGNAAGVQGGSNAAYAGTAFIGTGNATVNHFYRDVVIPAGSININLSFYLKMPIIDNTFDYLYVYTTATANTPVAGTLPSTGYTTVLSYTTPALTGYTLQSFTLPNALAGTTVRLVFTYKSDGASPYAVPAVDNISMIADVPVPVPATFSWTSSPAGFTSTEQNPAGVVQSTETQYIITAFNSYGCYAWNSTTVTMAEGAAIALQPVPATKCSGQTATFSVTATGPGLVYQWRKGGIDIDPGTNPSSATNTLSLSNVTTGDEATYDVVISSSCGTPVTSDGAALTVIPSPVVTVSPTAASYCTPGSALTLTAGGAESYAWSPATGLDATTGEVVHASPAAITTYTVTGTALNGCTATATAAIGVGETVTMNSVTATPASVCSGGSTVLLANASIISTATYCVGPYSSGTGFGDYIVNVTLGSINNTTGASSSPFNTYYNVLSTNLTGGSGYTLTGIINNGGTEMVAAWIDYNKNGTFESGEKLGEYTGLNYSISFVVPLTAINGTTRLRVRNVYNTSGILPCNTYSYGEIEDYNVVISGASSIPLTYTWSESPASGTLASTSGNPTSATGIITDQTYTVTAMATTGCSATGNVVVSLGVPIACTNITSTNACDATDFSVTANNTGGGGTLHYAWSDGGAGVYPDAQTVTANLPAGAYTFSVTVTDGCATTCEMSQEITVGTLPGGSLAGPSTGLTYVPMVYTVTGFAEGATFVWQFSTTDCNTGFSTIPGVTTAEASLNAASAGTFYIRCLVTGTNGCVTTTNCISTTVTVNGDNVCSAIPLSIGLNGPYSNVGATIEAGEPVPPGTGYTTQTGWGSGQTISNTVWFSFVAPPSGRVSIGNNPNFNLWDNQFALYSGLACEGFEEFTQLAANDDSTSSIDPFKAWIAPICLNPGETYYFQVDGYGIGVNNTWGIRLQDEGNSAPVISGCPANIEAPVNAAGCTANVSWTAPTASDPDNCLTPLSFTSNYSPGANFPLGTTTVTYTANDGINPPVTCSFNVIVTTAGTISISGEPFFCEGLSTMLDAGDFSAYLWSTGETSQSITVSSAGIYAVTVTDGYGCTATGSADVYSNPNPQGSISANGPFCASGAGQLTWFATEGTGPFTIVYNDGIADRSVSDVISGTPFDVFTTPVTETTTYTLVSVTDVNCTRTTDFTGASATITVYPQPQGTLSANGPFCATGAGQLTWSATAGTGPFTVVYNDGDADRTISGIESGVAFDVFTSPVEFTTIYTLISVTDEANDCERTTGFTGSEATIVINLLPQGSLMANGPFCGSGSGKLTFGWPHKEVGGYTIVYNDGVSDHTVYGVQAGQPFDVFTTPVTTTTTYTLVSVTNETTGCVRTSDFIDASATIIIYPNPVIYDVTGGGSFCSGEPGANIYLSGTEMGVEYELWRDGSPTGTILVGNCCVFAFTGVNVTGTYTVVATNADGCSIFMNGSAIVIENPLPETGLNVGGTTVLCFGQSADITVDASVPGTTYQLRNDDTHSLIGLPVEGTGGTITLPTGALSSTTPFSIIATITATGCSAQLLETTSVQVNPLPDVSPDVYAQVGLICTGTETNILINPTQAGTVYFLRNDADNSGVGFPQVGTGGVLTFPTGNLTVATTFNVYAINPATGCEAQLDDKATVVVMENGPAVAAENVDFCPGAATIDFPITVSSFNSVGSLALTFGFVPAEITAPAFVDLNPAFASWDPFTYTTDPALLASGVYKVSGFGINPMDAVSLPDNAVLFKLRFNIMPGTTFTTLTFVDDAQGTACEFTGPAGDYLPYCDAPAGNYYFSGSASEVPAGVVNQPADEYVCNGSLSNTIDFTSPPGDGTITYMWTNDNTSIGLAAAGTGDINPFLALNATLEPVEAHVTVTPYFTTSTAMCPGEPKTFTITVNPGGHVIQPATQVVCNGATTSVSFSSGNIGGTTTYAWTNSNTNIGLDANGIDDIASFTAVNTTNTYLIATIVVTPTYHNFLLSCDGPSKAFTITVNPDGQVNAVANQEICHGNLTSAVAFSTVNYGGTTTYSWTNDHPEIGLAATGTGNIAAFTAINAGTLPVVATITVTPYFSKKSVSCPGTPALFTITVNPQVTLAGASQTTVICAGSSANIGLTGLLPNTTSDLTYTIDGIPQPPVTGLVADAIGEASFTTPVLNASDNGKTLTITGITTTSYLPNCSGTFAQNVTLQVNPTSIGGSVASDQTICSGTSPADLLLSGHTGNVVKWQQSADAGFTSPVDIPVTSATLSGAAIGNLVDNTYFRAVVQSGVCEATYSAYVLVTIIPNPTLAGALQAATVCEGFAATINLSGLLPSTTSTVFYSINGIAQSPVTGVISNVSGEASFLTPILSALNNTQLLVIESLVVTSAVPNCTGSFDKNLMLSVDPASVGGSVAENQTICAGTSPADLTLSGYTGSVIKWQQSADAAFTSPTDINVTADILTGTTIGNLYTSAYFRAVVQSGVCSSAFSASILVTVNPTPTITGASQAASVCDGLTAVINLAGLLPFSTSTIDYSINGVPQSSIGGIAADGSGNASFMTPALAASNNGQILQITGITVTSALPYCSGAFAINVTLGVYPQSVGGAVADDQTICAGSSPTNLTLSGHTGSVVKWQRSSNLAFTSPTDIAVTSTTLTGATIGNLFANTYFRAVVQSGTCDAVNSASVLVTVNLTPVLVTNPQAACSPSRVNLTLPAVTAGSTLPPNTILPFTYWTNALATIPVPNPASVGTGTYYIKAITSQGCYDIKPVTVTINPLPFVFAGTGSGCYCPANEAGLVVGLAGSQVGVEYSLWIGITQVYGPVAGTGTAISFGLQSLEGIYWVLAENMTTHCFNRMDNCIHICITTPVAVSVNITPSANPVAAGTSVTYTATPVNGGATPSYQWQVNGFNAGTNSPSFTYMPVNEDEVTCIVTSSETCNSGPATSNTIVMNVTGVAPAITVTGNVGDGQTKCYNATGTLTVAGGGTTFTVHSGGSATMIAGTNILYLPGTIVQSGGYMHGYISSTYCGTKTPAIVSNPEGENEPPAMMLNTSFKIYPNPTTGNFTLEQTGYYLDGTIRVEIYGMRGERVLSGEFTNEKKHEFSIRDFPTGVYFVKVGTGDVLETFKLVKTR